MIIYKITNILNGKFYIGMTKNSLDERINSHIKRSKNKKTSQTYFHRALEKYGIENFKCEIIDDSAITKEDMIELEIKYINELKPHYNLTKGGDGISEPTEEIKRKISESNKGKVFSESTLKIRSEKMKLKWKDDEYRKKVSESLKKVCNTDEGKKRLSMASSSSKKNKGKNHTEEHKKKISKALMGRPSSMKGKTYSDEVKKKVSDSLKGRIVSEETRRKISISNTGKKLSPERIKHLIEINTGRKHTDEVKKRISESHKKRYERIRNDHITNN